MKKIEAVIRPANLEATVFALREAGFRCFSVTEIRGYCNGKRRIAHAGGEEFEIHFFEKAKIELVLDDALAGKAVEVITVAGYTGKSGDGMIFVLPVDEAVQIKSGERGTAVL
jgi:nitrogen regulatory protein P-II 1